MMMAHFSLYSKFYLVNFGSDAPGILLNYKKQSLIWVNRVQL